MTATTAKALPKPPKTSTIQHVPTIIVLRLCVRDVYAGALDDQVLTTQRLGNLENKTITKLQNVSDKPTVDTILLAL